MSTSLAQPSRTIKRNRSQQVKDPDQVEHQVDPRPRIDAAAVAAVTVIVVEETCCEVTIGRSNPCATRHDELPNESHEPDDDMDNIGALAPIEERDEEV